MDRGNGEEREPDAPEEEPDTSTPPRRRTWRDPALLVAYLALGGTILASIFSLCATNNTSRTQQKLLDAQIAAQENQERRQLRAPAYQAFIQGLADLEVAIGDLLGQTTASVYVAEVEDLPTDFDESVAGLRAANSAVLQGAAQLRIMASEPAAIAAGAIAESYVELLVGLAVGDQAAIENFSESRCENWQVFVNQARDDLALIELEAPLENDPFCDPLEESTVQALVDAAESSIVLDVELETRLPACKAGDAAACDVLYLLSPEGSTEEEVGLTCGGRSDASGTYCTGFDPFSSIAVSPGDDPFLDELLDVCDSGADSGCFALYLLSPEGSLYADLSGIGQVE